MDWKSAEGHYIAYEGSAIPSLYTVDPPIAQTLNLFLDCQSSRRLYETVGVNRSLLNSAGFSGILRQRLDRASPQTRQDLRCIVTIHTMHRTRLLSFMGHPDTRWTGRRLVYD